VQVLVTPEHIRELVLSEEASMHARSAVPMKVAIEKDFRCLTRPEEQ
jgi:hypothetical protein